MNSNKNIKIIPCGVNAAFGKTNLSNKFDKISSMLMKQSQPSNSNQNFTSIYNLKMPKLER